MLDHALNASIQPSNAENSTHGDQDHVDEQQAKFGPGPSWHHRPQDWWPVLVILRVFVRIPGYNARRGRRARLDAEEKVIYLGERRLSE